jgi:hypothetical protein
MNPDHPKQAIVACAYAILQMAEETTVADPFHQAVLISMVLWEEAKDDGPLTGWEFVESECLSRAHRGLTWLRLNGYF